MLSAAEKELVDLYYSCDIYAQPSLAEALPTVITEAMMCGKPIVATKVGGIPEQVPFECGYLVDSKDSFSLRFFINDLIEDPWLRKTLGENARAHALKTYTQKKMVEKHIELYVRLVS